MNTPTPLTDEAWSSAFNAEDFSASSVARSMRVFSQKIEIELAAANEACRVASEDALLMRDDLYKQLAAATTERDQLRAEVERLRSDRDCEKRLRKDAEELREDAIERSMKAEAELAAEREKLDWVFQNCKVEANDYTTGNRDVYYVHDREDLGAAMKEDAK